MLKPRATAPPSIQPLTSFSKPPSSSTFRNSTTLYISRSPKALVLQQPLKLPVVTQIAQSQRLNGDAIVASVKALCKVAIVKLQSPTDPRVFSLTKIVEIAKATPWKLGKLLFNAYLR